MASNLNEEPEDFPAGVNLPLLAEDVTFDINIKRAAPEERTAALEEKRSVITEKAALAVTAFAVGNTVPSLFKEDTEKE